MIREDIEKIPDYVKSGKMNWEQASRELVVFMMKNKPMFGLQKYDEDFISDFIIQFLVRGPESLAAYETNKGIFISYLFCMINNIVTSLKKKSINENRIYFYNVNESIIEYENKVDAYQKINYKEFERPKVPYAYKPISYKDFQIACKTDTYHIKRVLNSEKTIFETETRSKLKGYSPKMIRNILLVVTLKSAYDITDCQIEAIASILNINKSILYGMTQQIKGLIDSRIVNKEIMEIRRNRAYFKHKTLREQIKWNEMNLNDPHYENLKLCRIYEKNTKSWTVLNHQLEEGKIHIRPTTKLIAKVLGMSARQVTYHQTVARKLGINICKV